PTSACSTRNPRPIRCACIWNPCVPMPTCRPIPWCCPRMAGPSGGCTGVWPSSRRIMPSVWPRSWPPASSPAAPTICCRCCSAASSTCTSWRLPWANPSPTCTPYTFRVPCGAFRVKTGCTGSKRSEMKNHDSDRIDTLLQHTGQAPLDPVTGAGPVALPSYRTSTVRFASMDVLDRAQAAKQRGERVPTYGRVGLQTHEALETLLCRLEGGERAFLAPSGMAAISMALMALLGQGDHALVVDCVYGPVRYLHKTVLSRMGVSMDFVRGNLAALQAALRPETRVLYLESPGSLLMEMLDLPAL